MKIGTKIRQIRQHRRLTQRELGEKIGLGKNGANRVAQYEMGYRMPKREQLNKIDHALNVSEKMLSMEANKTLQTLLQRLFWLDQEEPTLIELFPVNEEKCQQPCNPTSPDHIAIVVHDQAFQNLLTRWNNEKTFLSGGIIDQNDYFGWKIGHHLQIIK